MARSYPQGTESMDPEVRQLVIGQLLVIVDQLPNIFVVRKIGWYLLHHPQSGLGRGYVVPSVHDRPRRAATAAHRFIPQPTFESPEVLVPVLRAGNHERLQQHREQSRHVPMPTLGDALRLRMHRRRKDLAGPE